MRAGLVTKVMEHINILVSEWFSGIKPELIIPCPYCMESRAHTALRSPIHLPRAFSSDTVVQLLTNPVVKGGQDEDVTNAYVFSFDDCVWQSRNSSVIYCPAHGDIPLKFFVPDVVSSIQRDMGSESVVTREYRLLYIYILEEFIAERNICKSTNFALRKLKYSYYMVDAVAGIHTCRLIGKVG